MKSFLPKRMHMNKSRFKKKILIWDFVCLVLLNILDRLAKYASYYYCENENFILIKDYLEITYTPNSGGAFGILYNQRFFFIFIAALFICLIVFFLFALPDDGKFNALHIWLSFILSGTIGNMADRIIYGNVIDMIYISKIDFPIFNLSDIFISLGTIFTSIVVLFILKEKDFEFLNFKQNKYREIK